MQNPFFTTSDLASFPSIAPKDPRTGMFLTDWARGNYGANQGATDTDHLVNGTNGETSAPNPRCARP